MANCGPGFVFVCHETDPITKLIETGYLPENCRSILKSIEQRLELQPANAFALDRCCLYTLIQEHYILSPVKKPRDLRGTWAQIEVDGKSVNVATNPLSMDNVYPVLRC